MLRNYLKITWRNLRQQPGFAFINIFGLAAGLTCFALISLWVNDELNYDRFNKHYDRIVRVTTIQKTETGVEESARTGALVAKALAANYEEVERTVRLRKHGEEIVQYQNNQTLQPNILLTEPAFFDVFSYHLTKGNVATALQEPYSVVLTESTARNYFGGADPMGQVLTIYMYDSTGRGANYKVTGIMPDPPRNAHFTFTMLGSFKTVEVAKPELLTASGWTDVKFYTYCLLRKGVVVKSFSDKIARLYASYRGHQSTIGRDDVLIKLQPLGDIHLRSRLEHEIAPTGDINQVYIFSTIGIFILLLAGINYTNLATARSAGRAKEVSIKKVVGAVRTELVVQYLTESVFTVSLALLLSGLLALGLQPFLNALTGKALSLFSSPMLLLFLTGVTFLLGILSGLYPAFVISSFKPASILKGAFRSSGKGIRLRQSLVVLQFVITLLLLISIVTIYSQMTYIRHKDLGYNKTALLFVRVNGNADVVKGYYAFRNKLTTSPLIAGITISNSMILNGLETGEAQTTDEQGKSVPVTTARLEVDANYLTVYGVKRIAGRNFMPQATGSSIRQVLLNESAVKRFGWKNAHTAIGKPFTMDGQPGTVVGVVSDFHFNSLQHRIEPLAILLKNDYFSRITIKLDSRQVSQCLAFVKTTWTNHFPGVLFDYAFLDHVLDEQYQAEARFSTIVTYFSILSLVIACLGLYGLVAYSTAQRTKEIGVRKVLGASVASIVTLLSKDFLKLVLIAIVIASPIAYYVMQRWLQDFAYRIRIEWWVFALAGTLAVGIALLTVSFQSVRAALMNPVKSLRSE